MPLTETPVIRRRVRPALQPVAAMPAVAVPAPTATAGSNWGLGGPPLQIVYCRINALILPPRQLRRHKPKQITQVAASIAEFGCIEPLLVDAKGMVVAGVCRLLAARELGMIEVPTICIDHLSDAQRRAYAIAANRLAELSGWDDELLRLELGELAVLDLDFSIELTGFATAEIDAIVLAPPATDADPDDVVPDVAAGPSTTRLGDCFVLGDHGLVCGDARDAQTYAALMGAEKARMVFSDAPYNVKIQGHVCGLGAIKHDEFAMASGEMSQTEFTTFLTAVFVRLVAASVDGSIHYQCMDFRHMGEMLAAGTAAYSELKNLCVWKKLSGGMGTFYRSQHELVFVYKSGRAPHTNNLGLGETGRYRTNVWSYAGVNSFGQGRMADLAAHPTVKPTALVADAIRDVSRRGEIILDPFCGSGTTIMAAERTGRRARCIELEPKYVDVAIRRWEQVTGKKAVHIESGMTMLALAEARSTDNAAVVS